MADGKRRPRGARGLKILVLAVGKAAGPERDLCERYAERAGKLGRQIGLRALEVREIADGSGPTRTADEGAALLKKVPEGPLVVLDERGTGWSSARFGSELEGWLGRVPQATFALGGADGHDDSVRQRADHVASLGAPTLPHLLARVILLEQIYRAVTLCAGHPYHRA